jgi:hypothetical protein
MADTQQAQIELLKQMLAEHQGTLDAAKAIVHREYPIVSNLEATITSLEGRNAKSHDQQVEVKTSEEFPASKPVPARKPEYAGMTIIGSIQRALEKRPEPFLHVDEIVKDIYEPIADSAQFYRVKRTVVSELLRGEDRFKRDTSKKNTFGLIRRRTAIGAAA